MKSLTFELFLQNSFFGKKKKKNWDYFEIICVDFEIKSTQYTRSF